MPSDTPANDSAAKSSRLAEIFGEEDVLPRDEQPEGAERSTDRREKEFHENRPPHYG